MNASTVNTANISYAKDHFSDLIARVKSGHTITILDRRRPVARLTPIAPESGEDWVRDLVRRGVLSEPREPLGRDALERIPLPRPRKGADIVAALIADREDRV